MYVGTVLGRALKCAPVGATKAMPPETGRTLFPLIVATHVFIMLVTPPVSHSYFGVLFLAFYMHVRKAIGN